MDPTDNKAADSARRASLRNSTRLSAVGLEDDYDFAAAAAMVSDGFRPAAAAITNTTPNITAARTGTTGLPTIAPPAISLSSAPIASSPPPTPTSTSSTVPAAAALASSSSSTASTIVNHDANGSTSTLTGPRPSSIAKPPRPQQQQDPFALRHDGVVGALREAPGVGVSRSLSVSTNSSAPFVPDDSPYQGPSGPSHPYQMYPQNVRPTRTPSVATSSTARASESSYAGPTSASHPYGLYHQGTAVDDPVPVPNAAIPVGFNAVPDQYQRRLGPEGEDLADIIGPDGHTEQLPPYTRYPDETYARKVIASENGVQDHVPSPSPAVGAVVIPAAAATFGAAVDVTAARAIPGAGGLGLATHNPEFDSALDLSSPQSREWSQSFQSDADTNHITMASSGLSEKLEKEQALGKWQMFMRQKLWGVVPAWVVCFAGLILFAMAVILGTTIGIILSKHAKAPKHFGNPNPGLASVTITYDASQIPTPANLRAAATGSFGMPINLQEQSSSCFNNTADSQAWSCSIMVSNMVIEVNPNEDTSINALYTVSLSSNESLTMANYVYAFGEQPPVLSRPLPMTLVNDTNDPQLGPAWFAMSQFDKVVIIPESALQAPGGSSSGGGSQKRARYTMSLSDISGGSLQRKGIAQHGDRPWICHWPNTTQEIFIYVNQNTTYSQSPKSLPTSMFASGPTTKPPTFELATGSDNAWMTSTPTASSFGAIDTGSNAQQHMPPYPRYVKLEERRMAGAPEPACTQYEIQSSGPAKVVRNSDGSPVVVNIAEYESGTQNQVLATLNERSSWSKTNVLRPRGGSDISDCGCEWFLS